MMKINYHHLYFIIVINTLLYCHMHIILFYFQTATLLNLLISRTYIYILYLIYSISLILFFLVLLILLYLISLFFILLNILTILFINTKKICTPFTSTGNAHSGELSFNIIVVLISIVISF